MGTFLILIILPIPLILLLIIIMFGQSVFRPKVISKIMATRSLASPKVKGPPKAGASKKLKLSKKPKPSAPKAGASKKLKTSKKPNPSQRSLREASGPPKARASEVKNLQEAQNFGPEAKIFRPKVQRRLTKRSQLPKRNSNGLWTRLRKSTARKEMILQNSQSSSASSKPRRKRLLNLNRTKPNVVHARFLKVFELNLSDL